MGRLTFGLSVTLDGCCDHRVGVVDDERLRSWTRLMDSAGAMLFGRTTHEMMEAAWRVGLSTCTRGELGHVRVLNVIRVPAGAITTLANTNMP